MEDNSVLNSLEKISPVTVYKDRLQYLNLLFNLSLKSNPYDSVNYSPVIKLAFLGKGNHYLDRLFVVEETETMITMVKNVSTTTGDGVYKRSAYMMMRQAFKFVHFDTGSIISDLLEYAHLEVDEIAKHFYFWYEGKAYGNIIEISSRDTEYKSKVSIVLKSSNTVFENNINMYIYNLGVETSFKIGYYIPDESILYFHVMVHMPDKFGGIPDIGSAINSLLADPNNFSVLINSVLSDISPQITTVNDENKKSKGKKKLPKNKFLGISLITKISETASLQMKRIFVGWFICEVLYQFFFYN